MAEEHTTVAGGGIVDEDGKIKASPYIVEVKYTSEMPSAEDLAKGAEICKEFYDLDNDDQALPAGIASITIKRK